MAFKIKINKAIPAIVSKDNETLKATVILFQLKSLYKVKVIKYYRKRWSELSKALGVSESKLRAYVGVLRRLGWAIESKDGSLYLIGRKKHCKLLGITKCNKYHAVSFVSNKKLEVIIFKYALHENKERQEYIVRKKIVNKKVQSLQINDEGIRKKMRKRILKSLDIGSEINLLRGEMNFKTNQSFRFDSVGQTLSKNSINPFVSMSRKKIGELCGGRSEASGKRIANKLKKYKLMEDEPRKIVVQKNVTKSYFSKLDLPGCFFFWKGSIWKKDANLIRLLPDTLINNT